MLLNTKDMARGNKAQLFSETLKATPASCFSFYLSMNPGNDSGTLNVYMDDSLTNGAWSLSGHLVPLWSSSIAASKDWTLVQVLRDTVNWKFDTVFNN